jgi:hypothetical protein
MRAPACAGALVAMTVTLAACVESEEQADGELVELDREHLRLVVPDGWTQERELDSLLLVGPPGAMHRTTIAIRALARPEQDTLWVDTLTVLRALPEVRLGTPRPVDLGTLRGNSVELSFAPPGHDDERYARRHVVLVGEWWAFHVIHTAPAGELPAGADVFQHQLNALQEVP